jgi:pyruvate dehydrogenase E2 component (dihydrolipoamide acetyltransferase)
MAFEFRLPDLGEGLAEGDIRKWLVKEGDRVKADQTIAEVETAKAVVELPSPRAGTILKLHAPAGSTIKVGDVIVTIGDAGEKAAAAAPAAAMAAPAPKPPAPAAKTPVTGKSVSVVGELPEEIDLPLGPAPAKAAAATEVRAVPAARALARQLAVDLAKVTGTGPDGIITADDVKKAGEGKEAAAEAEVSAPRGPRMSFDKYGRILRIPLRGMRKAIAEHLVQAEQRAVHVTHMDEADVTRLWEVREKEKALAEEHGYPLTFLPFVMKAAIIALKEHPYLNAAFDDAAQEIVTKQYYSLGFAVDTTEGLLVPVIKNADRLSIMEIAKELKSFSDKARDRSLTLDDLQGSTFTITNIGSLGGIFATPILNYPEAAILGLGRIRDMPRVVNGKIEVRKVLPFSVSFDHRVVDGARVARFANDLIKHLEDPSLLLVDIV